VCSFNKSTFNLSTLHTATHDKSGYTKAVAKVRQNFYFPSRKKEEVSSIQGKSLTPDVHLLDECFAVFVGFKKFLLS
jgi:hypothetical protein